MTAIKDVLAASVPSSKTGWISLPSFAYTIPNGGGEGNEEMIRFFTSSMLKLCSIATTKAFASAKSEVQLVALCKVDSGDGKMSFRSCVPYASIVNFVATQLPPVVTAKHTQAALESFTMPVKQRCALPVGGWAPVVIVYDPKAMSILLTNLNQIQSPEQFQNPHTCGTTSGFLNFLGTFFLTHQADDTQSLIQVNDIEALLGKGLDPWIRWIHHFMETGTAFESERVFVKADEPERYDYRYG